MNGRDARTMGQVPRELGPGSPWPAASECAVADLERIVGESVDLDAYPFASSLESGVLAYDSASVRAVAKSSAGTRALREELARCLEAGPGVLVLRGAFPSSKVIDEATEVFDAMIVEQRARGAASGDHFASPGANDRVWNALGKLAERAPEVFVDYYANDMVALVCSAWLGPAYQVTSQVNVVNPGGHAQSAHRDYHLGFQEDAVVEQMAPHVQKMSQYLTLQGAVAHCDMPVETGPTMYLPQSQKYDAGYLAWRRPDFQAFFEGNHVQLPLAKGDAVFFNPAVFHAAGTNRSLSVRRIANLLQVSSAFGRAMETVDRVSVSEAIYPVLVQRRAGGAGDEELGNAVAAGAEGYPFPTSLDADQPVAGLAATSQVDVVWRALEEGWDPSRLARELDEQCARRGTSRTG